MKVLGVLGGGDLSKEKLLRWAQTADYVLAADGGANAFLHTPVRPDLVVGDFDSVLPEALLHAKRHSQSEDQHTTDCDKLFAEAQELGFHAITVTCFEGDDLAHVLATVHSAMRSKLDVRLLGRRSLSYVVHPGTVSIEVKSGAKIGVIPLLPCEHVSVTGVKWPLNKVAMTPGGLTSISNVADGGRVSLSLASGIALLVQESDEEAAPTWEEIAVERAK
ncbi:MAG: thiamine diphosphokinase [Armatimonadetes bacterium]|nr:thiamine diphosphokinase [Armatimonadota bacterium]